MHGVRVHNEDEYKKAWLENCKKRGLNVDDPKINAEICEEIDVDLCHNELPDPEHEMIEIALRQIQRLEKRVQDLETELSAAKAEITSEARRTSALEVMVETPKINLKKENLK